MATLASSPLSQRTPDGLAELAAPNHPRGKGAVSMATAAGSPEASAPTRILSTPLTRPPASRPLGPDLVRGEWTKLRSVQSA
jgi:hypothetical protein